MRLQCSPTLRVPVVLLERLLERCKRGLPTEARLEILRAGRRASRLSLRLGDDAGRERRGLFHFRGFSTPLTREHKGRGHRDNAGRTAAKARAGKVVILAIEFVQIRAGLRLRTRPLAGIAAERARGWVVAAESTELGRGAARVPRRPTAVRVYGARGRCSRCDRH